MSVKIDNIITHEWDVDYIEETVEVNITANDIKLAEEYKKQILDNQTFRLKVEDFLLVMGNSDTCRMLSRQLEELK